MARWNKYDYGDIFSEWHRKHEGLRFIDLDYMETCHKCQYPIFISETARWTKDEYKDCRATQAIAKLSDLEAYVILCKPKILTPDQIRSVMIYKERVELATKALKRETGLDPNQINVAESFRMRQIFPTETKFKDVSEEQMLKIIWRKRNEHKCAPVV